MKTLLQYTCVSLLAFALTACDSSAQPSDSLEVAASGTFAAQPRAVAPPPATPQCADCGTITSIEPRTAKGSGSGMGAVAGAVAGAVVGHQIGSGRGNDAATVAGAIGGGFAGNEIEKQVKSTTYFHVNVVMQSGGTRSVDVDTLNGLAVGSRVRVIGNKLQVAGV